ncbi:hypothetical protein [Streptomyces sp. NPDC058694]|uniref:hypothetical protein n=1 Tax=Streptomyces sp. NPDC058694 TaxID=3346603 RepID=UPI003668A737
MTRLSEFVGGLGAGLVRGRAHSDLASVEVARTYAAEPLLREARVPRMTLPEVTIEVKCAIVDVGADDVEIRVTPRELVEVPAAHLSTIVLKWNGEDIDPVPPNEGPS